MKDREPFIKERLFCPGPTPVPIEAKIAAVSNSVYHRTEEFFSTFYQCRQLLAPIFGGAGLPLILTSSGTGAMEAAVVNLTQTEDEVITVTAGKFGERWHDLTSAYGCKVHTLEVEWGSAPRAEQIVGLLKKHPKTKAIFIHANETSTGVYFPLEKFLKEIRKESDCLVVVDAISALGAHEMRMDDWKIDCVVSGSQKGFGIPPGLSFIALSDRAWQQISKREKFYFDLKKEAKGQDKGASAFTPASSLIASLRVSLDKLHEYGIAQVLEHHRNMAHAVRDGILALGLDLVVKENFSHSLTSVWVPQGIDGSLLLKSLKDRYGAVFAGGQEKLKGRILRFAHLGFSDRFDVLSGMAALEFALKDVGYQFDVGAGVTALMKSLTQ
ncbi:MAG: alanine--glyoxylate aminotransferase family protein [Bdellovibrionota bacterium]